MRSEYVERTKKDLNINYEYGRNSECSKNSPSRFNNRYGLVLRRSIWDPHLYTGVCECNVPLSNKIDSISNIV